MTLAVAPALLAAAVEAVEADEEEFCDASRSDEERFCVDASLPPEAAATAAVVAVRIVALVEEAVCDPPRLEPAAPSEDVPLCDEALGAVCPARAVEATALCAGTDGVSAVAIAAVASVDPTLEALRNGSFASLWAPESTARCVRVCTTVTPLCAVVALAELAPAKLAVAVVAAAEASAAMAEAALSEACAPWEASVVDPTSVGAPALAASEARAAEAASLEEPELDDAASKPQPCRDLPSAAAAVDVGGAAAEVEAATAVDEAALTEDEDEDEAARSRLAFDRAAAIVAEIAREFGLGRLEEEEVAEAEDAEVETVDVCEDSPSSAL